MDKLEEAMAWFDYSHEASMIPGDAWARSCDKHGKVLSVAIRLLQARLKESVVALGVSRVDRIAELEDALAVGLEQIKKWHKGAGTNPEHDSAYGRMAKIAGPGRTQEPQDKRIKDLEAKFAIEKRAADHWMQEANKDHNNLVRAEAKLCKVQEEAIDNAHDAANLYEGRCDLCQDEVEMREEAEAKLARLESENNTLRTDGGIWSKTVYRDRAANFKIRAEKSEFALKEAREALQEIRDREHGLQRCRNPEAHWDSCDHSEACQRAGKALAAKTADNRR